MTRHVIAWAIAAISAAVAVAAWLGVIHHEPGRRAEAADALRIRELHDQLLIAQTDALVLRAELARYQAAAETRTGGPSEVQWAPQRPSDAAPEKQKSVETVQPLVDTLVAGLRGGPTTAAAAAQAMMDLLRAGPEAWPAVRKAFDESAEASTRLGLLPAVMRSAGGEFPAFVKRELARSDDPQLKATLLRQAAAIPELVNDPDVRAAFAKTLENDSQDDFVAKAAAIEALSTDPSPETEKLLLSQASSSDERVRLAAVRALSARPDVHDQLQELIARDPSQMVRRFGECAMLVSQQPE